MMKLRSCVVASGLVAGVALALSGCKGGVTHRDANGAKALTVGVVFDSGGIGDQSFNDSANRGLERAKSELGIDAKTVSSRTEQDYATNLDAMASGGCDVVFAVGLNQENALREVAPKYPKVDFAIVDGTVDAPNVRSLHFDEEQGSFLAGYLAALVTKSHKLGFVGGEKLALIAKFYCGYCAGAKLADPNVEILPDKYVGSWEDTVAAHAAALQLFGQGADIIYHAAGRAGGGVFKAAEEQNKFAIGVDSDQDHLVPGHILTSMVKHVDNAVFQTIKDARDGRFTGGTKVYDLASGGVGLTEFKYTKNIIGQSNIDKLGPVSAAIISGKIRVPATQLELDAFLKNPPKL